MIFNNKREKERSIFRVLVVAFIAPVGMSVGLMTGCNKGGSAALTSPTNHGVSASSVTGAPYIPTQALLTPKSNSIRSSTPPQPTSASEPYNEMEFTVDGSTCDMSHSPGYFNKPCATVTICQPGTGNCATIDDILIDTGSYGLRVFSSVLPSSLNLQQVMVSGAPLAECSQFMDGSALWGPVETADVILVSGGERASSIPILVIDSSYGKVPSGCGTPASGPTDQMAGYNGILGVGLFTQDCGEDCDPSYNSSSASNGIYFNGSTGTGIGVPLASQVVNPVSRFPVNNNGVIVELPSISSSGEASTNGSLIFGIGTGNNSNNTPPSSVKVYQADANGNFVTVFNGVTYSDTSTVANTYGSFIDSGSNSYGFPAPAGLNCCDSGEIGASVKCSASNSNGWFCPLSPSSPYSGTATNKGASGTVTASVSSSVSFQIVNYETINSNYNVFNNIGSDITAPDLTFDWGLPFFFGRDVFVGFQGTTGEFNSASYAGPYWAY